LEQQLPSSSRLPIKEVNLEVTVKAACAHGLQLKPCWHYKKMALVSMMIDVLIAMRCFEQARLVCSLRVHHTASFGRTIVATWSCSGSFCQISAFAGAGNVSQRLLACCGAHSMELVHLCKAPKLQQHGTLWYMSWIATVISRRLL
jgi:hypothetical protein